MKCLSTCIVMIVLALPIQTAYAEQSSNDDQLRKEVEQFASTEEDARNSAWKSLQRRNRATLIADLTRIVNAAGAKHNSLNTEDSRKVQSYLENVPRSSKLRFIAEQTLRALRN